MDQIGDLLRSWRTRRGLSQLQLSLDAGLSQRHLSFVESGKTAPSRQTILTISETLDVPLTERNLMLLAAGFAPHYSEQSLDDAHLDGVVRALKRMLDQHNPYPAVVMDRYWNVVMANESAPRFFQLFVDLEARPRPRNMLHLMFDPAGMRPFIANWPAVAASLLARVRRESVGRYTDERTHALIAALRAYPDVDAASDVQPAGDAPVVPLSFVKDGVTLNYFSIVSTVGTPQAVAAQELRMESMFPLDAATEAHHLRLLS